MPIYNQESFSSPVSLYLFFRVIHCKGKLFHSPLFQAPLMVGAPWLTLISGLKIVFRYLGKERELSWNSPCLLSCCYGLPPAVKFAFVPYKRKNKTVRQPMFFRMGQYQPCKFCRPCNLCIKFLYNFL